MNYAEGINEAIQLQQASLGGTVSITGTLEQGRVTVNDAHWVIVLNRSGGPSPSTPLAIRSRRPSTRCDHAVRRARAMLAAPDPGCGDVVTTRPSVRPHPQPRSAGRRAAGLRDRRPHRSHRPSRRYRGVTATVTRVLPTSPIRSGGLCARGRLGPHG